MRTTVVFVCALTLELTGHRRRDGLARAGRMYRVPQAGPRQPAVVGPVVQRGVMPHPAGAGEVGQFCQPATEAAPSRLKAEQGRYSAAAGTSRGKRLAARGAVSRHDLGSCSLTGRVSSRRCLHDPSCSSVFGCWQLGCFIGLDVKRP